jgi:hypothetical protein
LSRTDTDRKISDESILGLAGTMGHHDTPASGVGVSCGLQRFGDTSDLVDLEEEGIACFLLNGVFDTDWVGDGEIVADYLTVVFGTEVGPSFPVILIKWILDTTKSAP